MTVTLNAGMIIKNITSSSHKVNVNYPDVKTAEIFLSNSNENPSNRDFILNYNLRGNKIQSGLLLYEGEEENFFTYQMEPTKRIALEDIPAREYLFIFLVPIPVETNQQNIEAAIRFLSEGQGGGGTQLLSALHEAYKLPRKNTGSARSMVIITDGYVSVEKEAFELIRNNLDQRMYSLLALALV
ncbi:hypothetical protein GQR58_026381 [Nymphon striatum]|nr:hypothetical protein GQR58_026381 [Nymphon striatum]